MNTKIEFNLTIPEELCGLRLDQALAKLLPDYSRTQIQEWLKNNEITVNDQSAKSRDKILGGENIIISAQLKPQPKWEAQAIQLDILYEDEALLVINKPAGMVVHPAAGNPNHTLLNALIYHAPNLQALPRAGIIHRLDKDTSGLLVIAKTPTALHHLLKQMKKRSVVRIYQAIVSGVMTSGGMIDAPIGRHPIQRKKMSVIETGKPSVTHYRIIEKYRDHTRLKIQLETGRTHQIRVHMAHIRYPLLGDPVYGGRLQLPKGASAPLIEKLRQFKRQALHAYELELIHPLTKKRMSWQAELPDDLLQLIAVLKQDIKR